MHRRGDDMPQAIPARLDGNITVTSGDQAGAKPHGEVRESELDLRGLVLSHPSIDEDLRAHLREERSNITDVHGNGLAGRECFSYSNTVVCAHHVHALQDNVSRRTRHPRMPWVASRVWWKREMAHSSRW